MYHRCACLGLLVVFSLCGTARSDSLAAHWQFNEGTGSTAYDSSVNTNNGTLYNMAEDDWVSGRDGTALEFDGSDDYVQVPDDSSISFGTGSFSLAFWMKSDTGTGGELIHNGTSVAGTYSGKRYATALTGGKIYFAIDDNATKQEIFSSSIPDLTGSWHHIACYRNGTAGSIHIYIDGYPGASSSGGYFGNIDSPGEPLYISRRGPDESANCFPGKLDDIRIYDYVLSPTQIQQLASLGNYYAWNPLPGDGAITDYMSPITLSWSAGTGAASHDVYFGTNESVVTNASRLAGDINGDGWVDTNDIAILAGQWLGTPAEPYADLDDDNNVNLIDYSIFAADWLDAADAVFKGNQTATSYYVGSLPLDTIGYWRIDEVSGSNIYTGQTWNFRATEPVTAIMPLGDSITQGFLDVGPYRYYLWNQLVSAGYTNIDFVGNETEQWPDKVDTRDYDIDHEGHFGWSADTIAANVYGWLQLSPPDIILLHIGTNGLQADPVYVEDILDEIDRYENDYNHPIKVILAKIINRNFSCPTSERELTSTFNNNLGIMAQNRINAGDDIVVVDMENGAGIDYSADMWDELHPTYSGHEKMATLWFTTLQTILP